MTNILERVPSNWVPRLEPVLRVLPEHAIGSITLSLDGFLASCSNVDDFLTELENAHLLEVEPRMVEDSLMLTYNQFLHTNFTVTDTYAESEEEIDTMPLIDAIRKERIWPSDEEELLSFLDFARAAYAAKDCPVFRRLLVERSPIVPDFLWSDSRISDFIVPGTNPEPSRIICVQGIGSNRIFAYLHVSRNCVSIETAFTGPYAVDLVFFMSDEVTQQLRYWAAVLLLCYCGIAEPFEPLGSLPDADVIDLEKLNEVI